VYETILQATIDLVPRLDMVPWDTLSLLLYTGSGFDPACTVCVTLAGLMMTLSGPHHGSHNCSESRSLAAAALFSLFPVSLARRSMYNTTLLHRPSLPTAKLEF
jgi:hypothetical protein